MRFQPRSHASSGWSLGSTEKAGRDATSHVETLGSTQSNREEQIVHKIRKAKLFVFLRQHRHELFNEAFQEELASLYRKAERGQPPVAPAMLALALILEAYTGVSDDEVIEATMMERRSSIRGSLSDTFSLSGPLMTAFCGSL
jgi:hypothetical protein